ncbi:PilW family protein [Propionispora hippei]|uniref:Prepilin-type N-terminal cleavage/methylation domain-containing protein n=1 Tax=Propionispora hippei DSM 15287 TaxID=1123003 RepID=A0A1M6AER0_9FIRM|nr:hypothetical protein [Propionispora hippei]SHI34881.1 hypothetical protein SAMN02745170_00132 [Propionispora hippei DSM 15287]
MIKRYKNKQGFFLTEILIGMAVMLIILAAIVPLFANTTKTIANGTSTNHMLQEGRWALDLMAKDIAPASTILTPANNSTAATLVFQRSDIAGNITYSLVNNELRRQIGSGTQYPLTNGSLVQIISASFQSGLNGENITITLSLTDGSHTTQLTRTVFLLNN